MHKTVNQLDSDKYCYTPYQGQIKPSEAMPSRFTPVLLDVRLSIVWLLFSHLKMLQRVTSNVKLRREQLIVKIVRGCQGMKGMSR